MTDSAPNPELLEEYGTDEVYLANLEKVASDTWLGMMSMPQANQSEWGRLVASRGKVQHHIDRQRAQAASINLQFRALESQRMSNTIENFGGAGTRRSRYIRAMQTQPYNVHPLMMAGGLGGMGGMGGGGLMSGPGAMGGMGVPAGYGAHVEAPAANPEAVMAEGGDGAMEDLEAAADMEVTSSVNFAEQMGRAIAREALEKIAANAYEVGTHYGRSLDSAEDALGNLGDAAGQAAVGTGKAIGGASVGLGRKMQGAATGFGRAVGALSRGARDYMSRDVQPTPNWGTGFTPATDTNQYGTPIY